jgi:hypothetical protein
VSKRIALIAATVLAVAGIAVQAANATPLMIVGFNDEANTLYGDADWALPLMQQLHTQMLRVNLYWGGNRYAVAKRKPAHPADPADPAYDWHLYDRLARKASHYGIELMFTIVFTPAWANGGQKPNRAPNAAGLAALHDFAYAAAVRYSGFYTPPVSQQDPSDATSSQPLPWEHYWTAWNEANNPVFLYPQWKKIGRRHGKNVYRVESARNYVKICNAVYSGVHSAPAGGEKVACGVTAPRGNDAPASTRPSTDPLLFMRLLKADGLRRFDAYAHHPYYGFRNEPPTFVPPTRDHAVQLGNINALIAQLTKLYGRKPPLWITEYGYQTKPDPVFGVTYAQQSTWLTQAYEIARRNPRIGMMLWFLLKDDSSIANGWQSGLFTNRGAKKPAFAAFEKEAALFVHR